jgi:anaerobic magnesium-protoporphyrin IX monomethyl ester cyclase
VRILYLPNAYSQQRQHEKKANIYPVRMAMECEYYRRKRNFTIWGYPNSHIFSKLFDKTITEPENLPFLTLPRPDRVFTRAKEYDSGNYKYRPGTHIMSATGCWHGRCSFCVEQNQPYEVREVEDVVQEIEECKSLGFKEVFDDSATFPTGVWLCEFTNRLRSIGIKFSCNTRISKSYPFKDMHNSGFRMVLFGIESANQYTLDRINKGVKVEDIIPTIKRAAKAGLAPHIAVMFGYPWETDEDARRTLRLVHYLLRKGYAKTAQASLYCPQDGIRNETHKKYVKRIYNVGFDPRFWWSTLRDTRNMADCRYLWRAIKSWQSSR